MGVEDISSVAQDYLKVIWSATEWGGPPISTKGLAVRFGTTQANVSETLRRLADQHLLDYRPYKPATLTARGTGLAVTMVRRHRIVETFLVTTLGYNWDEIHDEADQLEHAVSEKMVERIDRLLGYPVADPHGDSIPSPGGVPRTPTDTIHLPEAAPGSYTVVRVADTDPEVLARLRAKEVTPGARILVHPTRSSAPNVRISGPNGESLGALETEAIRVRP